MIVRTQREPPELPQAERKEQQIARIAWCYYMEGLTQNEVARRVGVSRMMVNRILAQCIEQGIVQIRVNARLASCVAREAELRKAFGLKDAVVLPTPTRMDDLATILGAEAGHYLSDRLVPDQSIGLGWGRALWSSLRAVRRRSLPGLSVVSLLGGLTRNAAMNTYECASRLADILDAACYYLAAPTIAGSEASRQVMLEQDVIQEVLERGRQCDLALVSVGELSTSATNHKLGLLSEADLRSLTEAGAVGDLLCSFVDAAGRVVDHPLNRRVIALPLPDLARIRTVILVAGGPAKIPVIRSALLARHVNVLITDEDSASALLGCAGVPGTGRKEAGMAPA